MHSKSELEFGGSPDLRTLDELIQRRAEAKLQSSPSLSTVKISDSPFSEEILECEFPKKFATPTFDYCYGMNDPGPARQALQDKMVVHSCNDPLLCLIFSSA